jgi:hypothetical protein
LKLGNDVARFDFDYLDLPAPTPGFVPRKSADGEMSFDPDTLKPRWPQTPPTAGTYPAPTPEALTGNGAPLAHKKSPQGIQQHRQHRLQPSQTFPDEQVLDSSTERGVVAQREVELAPQTESEEHGHAIHQGIF